MHAELIDKERPLSIFQVKWQIFFPIALFV